MPELTTSLLPATAVTDATDRSDTTDATDAAATGRSRAAPTTKAPRRAVARRRIALSESQSILRHWRDAVPDDRFAHLVKDATRSLQRSLQTRLAAFDVPFGYWTFLRVLWEDDGLTQKQLSDEVGVMEPTTFTAVRAMEARGWVERRQVADNRKNVYVFLTDAGRALRAKLVPLAEEVNGIAVKDSSAEDVAAARRVLLAIVTRLAADLSAQNATD